MENLVSLLYCIFVVFQGAALIMTMYEQRKIKREEEVSLVLRLLTLVLYIVAVVALVMILFST